MDLQELIEKVFHIDSNTSATILITIIVFLLGYVFTSVGRALSDFGLRKANRSLFIQNLETLLKSMKKRLELTEEQLRHLQIETFVAVPVGRIQFYQVGILNSMGHKNSFESFFDGFENQFRCNKNKKLRNKAFVKVWENLANIEFWENHMYELMEPADKEINRMNETMGKYLREMRHYYLEMFQHLNNPTLNSIELDFIKEIKKVVDEWGNQPRREHAYVVDNHLSKKIKVVCNFYSTLESARHLRNLAMDSSYWYGNIIVINQNLQVSLTQHKIGLQYLTKVTKLIIRILD